jgi:PAS domain S-box-containing protein
VLGPLLDGLAAPHALLDAQGRVLVANAAWSGCGWGCDLLRPGIDRGGSIARAACDATQGSGRASARYRDALATALGSTRSETLEHVCLASGAPRIVATRVTPLVTDGPLRVLVAHEDVSERRGAERAMQALSDPEPVVGEPALRALAQKLAALLDVRFAFVARLLAGAPARARTVGFFAENQQVGDFTYDVEGSPCALVLRGHIWEYGAGMRERFPHISILQELGIESFLGISLFSASDEPVGLLVAMDVRPRHGRSGDTQVLRVLGARAGLELGRMRVEEDLRRSERRLMLAFEGTNDGLFDWNIATGEVYGSPRLFGMLGYAPDELPPHIRTWEALTHPDDRASAARAIAAHVHGVTEQYTAELRLRCKSGEYRFILDRGKIVERDARGRALRMAGTHTDISERKRMEQQLLVADRMASVGTLAAGVAHEINNPLTYIGGTLEIIEGEIGRLGPAIPEQRRSRLEQAVGLAREGVGRVRDIVRDLQAFSRVDEADRREPVDVHQALEGAIRLADHEMRHGAHLVRDYAPVPAVDANPSRLGQVFLNLLVNATQALRGADPDRRVLRVGTRVDEIGRVVVTVEDTGEGMPPEVLSRIFDPFFTTKPVGVGVGLGLSICHGIVTALGGEITVHSTVGVGTRFAVTLPASVRTPAPPPPPPSSRREAPRGRVLVVDDQLAMGVTLRLALADEHDVIALTDGAAALERLRAGERFDLILCDLMMPDLTGMDLFTELSAIAPDQASRVVFMTGGASTPRARAFLAMVPNRVLDKPFDVAVLSDLVRERMSGR